MMGKYKLKRFTNCARRSGANCVAPTFSLPFRRVGNGEEVECGVRSFSSSENLNAKMVRAQNMSRRSDAGPFCASAQEVSRQKRPGEAGPGDVCARMGCCGSMRVGCGHGGGLAVGVCVCMGGSEK